LKNASENPAGVMPAKPTEHGRDFQQKNRQRLSQKLTGSKRGSVDIGQPALG